MKAYFDTSVMVTLTLQEDRWSALADWLIRHMPQPIFSDFGWGEHVSALGLKVRRGEVSSADASMILDDVADYLRGWTRLRVGTGDIDRATVMVATFSLKLRLPDAIHLALAERHRCTLISADADQIAAARHLGLAAINPYDVAVAASGEA